MRRGLSVCLLVSAVGIAACARMPPTHYYVLLDPSPPTPAPAHAGPSLGVPPFHVDAPYDQDRLVYRIGADSPEVRFYAYHRWAVPLSRMLAQVASETLAGTPVDEVLAGLRAYDRATLTPEQQLSYDVLEWVLVTQQAGRAFLYYTYPLNQFRGAQSGLPDFMVNIHYIPPASSITVRWESRSSDPDDRTPWSPENPRRFTSIRGRNE